MSLKGCFACMKYLVVIFNLLLWLAGIGVLAVAIWLYVVSSFYFTGGPPESDLYFTAIYILMAAGGIMTIVGFIGCCGALRESQCMLGTYFVLLLVIFAAELTGGVWAYMHNDEMRSFISTHVKTLIQEQYEKDPAATKTVDAMQHDLECCGIESPNDWSKRDGKGALEVGIINAIGTFTVPRSCCRVEDPTLCDSMRKVSLIGKVFNGIHTKGCATQLQEYIQDHVQIVAGVALGMAIAQILALLFAIILCCGIRDTDGRSYKA